MRGPIIAFVAFIVAACVAADAQDARRPEFDVASVKPSNEANDGPRGISFSPSGRFAWNRMTLKQLMSVAYGDTGIKDVAGGPTWIETARFDIAATSTEALRDLAPDGSPRGLFLRLRTLLEDRFQLKSRVEARELPVFVLAPAATPIAMGSGLRRVSDDCEAVTRAIAGRGSAAAPAAPPSTPGQPPPVPRCSMRASLSQVIGRAVTMAQLADALTAPTQRPVVDRTDLAGVFDVDLRWAPDLPPGALINGQPAPPSSGPSIFTAVREQLGLQLRATRADVPVLVIENVQMPSPD